MKILVTGSNGYIGQGVVRKLVDDGIEVTATDINVDKVDERVRTIECDLFAVERPFEYFGKPDVVLHLAWKNGFNHNVQSHMSELYKHYNFLAQLIEAGIKQVCGMGSVHEVGFYEGSVDEDTPTNPQSLYGISKNALRQGIELLCKRNNCCFQWIRGYYIVGNVLEGCSIFSKLAMSEAKGVKKFPFTLGLNQFDFLDYDEFCQQVAAVVTQSEITGIINCCSGFPEKIGERVERFLKENQYNIKLEYGAFPDRSYDSKAVWGDNKKINEIMKRHNMRQVK